MNIEEAKHIPNGTEYEHWGFRLGFKLTQDSEQCSRAIYWNLKLTLKKINRLDTINREKADVSNICAVGALWG